MEKKELPVELQREIANNAAAYADQAHANDGDDIHIGYAAGATAYASKLQYSEERNSILLDEMSNLSKLLQEKDTRLQEAEEKIKVLTYDNNKLKGEVEGLKEAVEELKGMAKRHAVGFAKWVSSGPVTEDDYKSFMMEPKALDESAVALNPELLQVIRDAELSKEDDLKAVKEVIGGTAGRDEAVEFAEWLIDNHYEITWGHKWVNFKTPGNNRFTSAEVYELFKQQKENNG